MSRQELAAKAEGWADNSYQDVDYSGCRKNRI